jgi:hypothetical protein
MKTVQVKQQYLMVDKHLLLKQVMMVLSVQMVMEKVYLNLMYLDQLMVINQDDELMKNLLN